MDVGVYLPFVVPILAVPLVRWLADRLHPMWATWLVTCAATVLAAGTTVALSLLTLAGLSGLSEVARWGHWSASAVRQADVIEPPTAAIATIALIGCVVAASLATIRRLRALIDAHRAARHDDHDSKLLIVGDDRPLAHALPGRPGRIVVSTGMLSLLDPAERRALLAHERAHLTYRHHMFVAVVDVMAAANVMLWPLTSAVRYTTERWADEQAAARVGDREVVARAVGKAALAARGHPAPAANAMAMGATAGPVPRRVAALLAAPPARAPRSVLTSPTGLFAMTALALTIGSAVCAADAAEDLHQALAFAHTPPAAVTASGAAGHQPERAVFTRVTDPGHAAHRSPSRR